jgi:hypothetical protein
MILRRERDNSRSLDKGKRIAKVNYSSACWAAAEAKAIPSSSAVV